MMLGCLSDLVVEVVGVKMIWLLKLQVLKLWDGREDNGGVNEENGNCDVNHGN